MTQTIPINDNKKFYSLTQNRSYRNQSKFTIDNISQNIDNSFTNKYWNWSILFYGKF